MTEQAKPILFSGSMVRAILEGRKTQARRIIKPVLGPSAEWIPWEGVGWRAQGLLGDIPESHRSKVLLSPRTCGGTLWVRETWQQAGNGQVFYRASQDESLHVHWKSPMHMPRWASRITLEITGVRVERVQDITAQDIIAEGAAERSHHHDAFGKMPVSAFDGKCYVDILSLWRAGWDGINKKRGFGWQTNPWVWVIEFKREA